MTWKEFLQSNRGRWAVAFCLATLCMMVFYMPTYYQDVIGPKKGILLRDPILDLFTPVDWSLPVFIILYLAVAQTLLSSFRSPNVVLTGLTTYCVVNLIRMLTMYLLTLEPPADMILLVDPISIYLVYPDQGFAKDLFFSGHVSTLLILVFIDGNRNSKALKVIGTAMIAVFLAWQHVHYTIDLLAAPVVTYWVFIKVQTLFKEA